MLIGVAQCFVAANLKGDVTEPDLIALWSLCLAGRWMLADVEGMKILAQSHENAAVIGVFLCNRKTENVAVETL